MSTPKQVRDYMRDMQRRSAESRWAGLTPAQRSAKMKAVRAAAKKKRTKTKARVLRQNTEATDRPQVKGKTQLPNMSKTKTKTTEAGSREPAGYTADEYTPDIKRQKAEPESVPLEVCENCHRRMKPAGGRCIQCGHTVRIG